MRRRAELAEEAEQQRKKREEEAKKNSEKNDSSCKGLFLTIFQWIIGIVMFIMVLRGMAGAVIATLGPVLGGLMIIGIIIACIIEVIEGIF